MQHVETTFFLSQHLQAELVHWLWAGPVTEIKCGSKIMVWLEYVRSEKGETPLSCFYRQRCIWKRPVGLLFSSVSPQSDTVLGVGALGARCSCKSSVLIYQICLPACHCEAQWMAPLCFLLRGMPLGQVIGLLLNDIILVQVKLKHVAFENMSGLCHTVS